MLLDFNLFELGFHSKYVCENASVMVYLLA